MRRAVTGLLVVAVLGVPATPALAANQTVFTVAADEYGGERFSPAAVQVNPGETVTWVNGDGGLHNVKFEDGLFESPAAPASVWPGPVQRSFAQAGLYRYYCEMHGAPGGVGMSGRVQVGAASQPPSGGGAGGGGGSGSPTGTPVNLRFDSLRVTRRRFCNRRGPKCSRPGIRLRIDLSAAGDVVGTLRRRRLDGTGPARRFGRVDFGTVQPGPRTLRFRKTKSGRRLTRGRYSLTLKAGQDTEVVRFRVTR